MSNMYATSKSRWNPWAGCNFGCIYCKTSFQKQAKRQKHRCLDCYNYALHAHPERLNKPLPKTASLLKLKLVSQERN